MLRRLFSPCIQSITTTQEKFTLVFSYPLGYILFIDSFILSNRLPALYKDLSVAVTSYPAPVPVDSHKITKTVVHQAHSEKEKALVYKVPVKVSEFRHLDYALPSKLQSA